MGSLAFLVTELELQRVEEKTYRNTRGTTETTLLTYSGWRLNYVHAKAGEKSLAILRSSPEQATASLPSDNNQMIFFVRCLWDARRRTPKSSPSRWGRCQRLIALKAVPQSAVALIVTTMNDAMSQGIDIQLRILQTLVSLITNFPSIHGELLGEVRTVYYSRYLSGYLSKALLLCFKLQDSRIAVVSSTAAATLRQFVMFIFEKMVDEDRQESNGTPDLSEAALPDGSTKALRPCAKDAFSVFEDLCLLAISEKLNFLKLDYLQKTFALELIESVLTNYHELFRKAMELLMLLQYYLCPLVLKALSDRHVFPLTLRCMRVIFLILMKFSFELEAEVEAFLMILIRMVSGDFDASNPDHFGSRPIWTRVLAIEIMRGDAELVRNIWDRYDTQRPGFKVFSSLVIALLLRNLLYSDAIPSGSNYGLDIDGVAGTVATAASATVSGVVGIIGSGIGQSVQNCRRTSLVLPPKPVVLSPEAIAAAWLSSLRHSILSYPTSDVLPKIRTLSIAGVAQLSSDLGYLPNIVRALNVEYEELDNGKSMWG
ncbi:guanine nucleotide exchange factor in Golgi transport N-terminal-domain-containing protein [Suillus subluteus]|nr:guanine nucleotide exchange factor in Golgi transport N-terminal-domain-containing protein [Suillus subluteus]